MNLHEYQSKELFSKVGIPILIGLLIFEFIIIAAAIKTKDGIKYRYPITIRFLY